MKKNFAIILCVMLSVLPALAQTKATADQVLAQAVSKISGAKGVTAQFSLSGSGISGSGTIKAQGGKFSVTMPGIQVWYNGKDLYTYNKKTSETTLVKPTAQELAEANPLAYVGNASKNYNVAYSTVKKSNKYVLELTPKKKGEVKRITLTLRQSDYAPEKIVIEPSKGSPITAEISSFKTGTNFSASDFEYPKNTLPKVEIIDMR